MKNTDTTQAEADVLPVQKIAVADIIPDPQNRKDHDPEKVRLLADSIDRDGLLQPVTVRRLDDGRYMLVAGERRWEAHKLLGREAVEARVLPAVEDVLSATRKRAAENLHREDLTPIEKAKQLEDLVLAGMTQAEVARFVGESQPAVANVLRLLKLPDAVRAMVHDGRLSRAHGVALARWAKWPVYCEFAAQQAVKEEVSAKVLEREDLPSAWAASDRGIIVKINRSHYGDGPAYTVPPALLETDDFVEWGSSTVYCLNPEAWAPEKAKQDTAREAAEKRAAAKAEKAKAKGELTAEQKERKQKIEKNKAARAEVSNAWGRAVMAFQQLAGKEVVPEFATVVLTAAVADGRHSQRLAGVVKALGLKVTKPDVPGLIEALGVAGAMRVACAAILQRQVDDALRFVSAVPPELAMVAKLAKAAPEAAKPAEKGSIKERAIEMYSSGRTPKEIAAVLNVSVREMVDMLTGVRPGTPAKPVKAEKAKKGAKAAA